MGANANSVSIVFKHKAYIKRDGVKTKNPYTNVYSCTFAFC